MAGGPAAALTHSPRAVPPSSPADPLLPSDLAAPGRRPRGRPTLSRFFPRWAAGTRNPAPPPVPVSGMACPAADLGRKEPLHPSAVGVESEIRPLRSRPVAAPDLAAAEDQEAPRDAGARPASAGPAWSGRPARCSGPGSRPRPSRLARPGRNATGAGSRSAPASRPAWPRPIRHPRRCSRTGARDGGGRARSSPARRRPGSSRRRPDRRPPAQPSPTTRPGASATAAGTGPHALRGGTPAGGSRGARGWHACPAPNDVSRSLAPVDEPWSDGCLAVRAQAGPELRFVTARCPLPVASVADLTVPDGNDLTAIRVHYLDSNGRGGTRRSPWISTRGRSAVALSAATVTALAGRPSRLGGGGAARGRRPGRRRGRADADP